MINVKIEDINYTLPTAEVTTEDFNKEEWLQKNPIDYYKLIYVLFNTANNAPSGMSRDTAMEITFHMLYAVTRLYIPDVLYKFYSFSKDKELNAKKLATLKNRQVYMSDIKDFNDPFDGKAFFYDPHKLMDIERLVAHKGRFIDDFTSFHKGTALTENDTSCMPMWAHYANNHQGFCVSYDMTDPDNQKLSSCTFPIQYTNDRLDITSFMRKYAEMVATEVDAQLAQGQQQIGISDKSIVYVAQYLSNIKHLTWQYEKEYRCAMGSTADGMPFASATPQAIYIGMNCSEENRNKLVEIAKKLSVPIYQMRFNEFSESYILEENPIDFN